MKLSLLSCGVALYPASSDSERVSFHNLNAATGNRVRQQMIDEETGEIVEREDRIKGYEVDRGEYIKVTDEELEAVEIRNNHTIEIERFIGRDEVDEIYFDRSYYVAPDGKAAAEAFVVIREAMAEQNVVALGRMVIYKRERVVVLAPYGKGLMATLMRYNYEVRSESEFFDNIQKKKIPGEMLDLAKHIIKSKSAHFKPETFKDRYQDAVMELIKAKQSGREPPKPPKSPPSNVVSLMDALRRSVKKESGGSDSRPAASRKTKTKSKAGGRTAKSRQRTKTAS